MARGTTRRRFIAKASMALAGALVAPTALAQMRGGGGGGGGGGMGGSGTTSIDPPVGDAFREPPIVGVRTSTGVEALVDAAVTPVSVGGTSAMLLTYGGAYVGPTIRARRGDVVRLRFSNSLPANGATTLLGHDKYTTNVHVHGWHVSPGSPNRVPADNVHVTVPPGGVQEYVYDLCEQRSGSIGLYHPHVHGSVAEQMWGGLVGALDVEDDPALGLGAYRRFVTVLKDITLSDGAPAPYTRMSDYMQGKEGALVTVNGQVNPYLAVEPGEVFRLRLVNASNARFYRLQAEGHRMYLIGADGGPVDRPYPISDLLMAPGERADLVLQAPTTASAYRLLSLPFARMGMMTSAQITLATIRVARKGTSYPKTVPTVVDPAVRRLDPSMPYAKRQSFALSMSMGRGYINGLSFEILADGTISSTEHHSMCGTDEIWEIVNQSNMAHPWHQHVNDAQLIAASGGDASYARYAQLHTLAPTWKDTIIVPAGGSITLRLPIRDYDGMTMFHCHILEHEDIGMMGMWHIMPATMGGM